MTRVLIGQYQFAKLGHLTDQIRFFHLITMKSVILFCCLFVAMGTAQRISSSNILDQATKAVKDAKSRTNTIMSNIKRNRQMHKMNTENELTNVYIQSSQTISNILTTRLNDIQKQLDEANAAGKDVANCLNTVSNEMKAAGRTGNAELNQCKNKGNELLENDLIKYDVQLAKGQELLQKLDSITLSCYTSNIIEMATCITVKVGTINIEIREYERNANELNSNSSNSKFNIVSSVRNCNSEVISKVRSASTNAIYAAANCLKN